MTKENPNFKSRLDKIEPWLLKTDWWPMSYMMIPSVLNSADELIEEMIVYDGPDRIEVANLLDKASRLRKNFHRDPYLILYEAQFLEQVEKHRHFLDLFKKSLLTKRQKLEWQDLRKIIAAIEREIDRCIDAIETK